MDILQPPKLLFPLATLLVAVLVTKLLLSHSCFRSRKRSLPFLCLPPEVRLQIYQNIIDRDPLYPVPEPSSTSLTSRLAQILHKTIWTKTPTGANLILLANKQTHAEYAAVLCKATTFKLTLSEIAYLDNKNNTSNKNNHNTPIWKLSPAVCRQIERCDIRIVADPCIIGSNDRMEGEAARLARCVAAALSCMPQLVRLTVHIHGLSNPLLLWYHASQAFKVCEDLPVQRVSLSSSCKTTGENHLARRAGDGRGWEWRCPENHFVDDGLSGKQPIRGFCADLYMKCDVCL